MDEIIYTIGQSLSVVGIALGFLSYQVRTQKQLLALQTVTSVVFCMHYLMIGATSGMAMNVVNALRNFTYFCRHEKGGNGKLIPIFFTVVMGIIGLFSWEAWYSIFVLAGLIIHALCMAFSDSQKVRYSILVSSPLILIYNFFVSSYGGIVYESVAVISSVIGILRYRKNKGST